MPVIRISEALFKEVQKYAEPLIDDFESTLWKILRPQNSITETRRKTSSTSRGEMTPVREFWRPILEILVESGGQADRIEVHKALEKKMAGRLKQSDWALNRDGTTKWSKHVDYQRLAMVHEGLLKRDSPRGVWEITEDGKQWLSQY